MALDTMSEAADELVPALQVLGNKHRLQIMHILSDGGSAVNQLANDLGLSRQTVGRHLSVLQEHGLVKREPSSENGSLFTLNRQKAAMLNASFLTVMGRLGRADGHIPTEGAAAPDETLITVVPQTPDACTQCQNASFVREVLDELDQSLVKARQYQVRLRQMSSHVLTAQEEERTRIARELHDDTAQALTSVLVRLRLLERSAEDKRLRSGLAELRELTVETLEGVRRLAIDLRPPMLDDLGLEAAIQSHVKDFSRQRQINVNFTSSGLGRLPPNVELVLYRIVQEALSNVAKHAGASRVETRLSRKGRTLRLLVTDDGCGFDVEAARGSRLSGLGLFGMEERLALIGGTLRVDSSPGKGTRLSAEVPLPKSPGSRRP